MQRPFRSLKTRRGFTLVELAVVIVIIGVLAAFGVPKFLQSVEKSKATEAFNYWSAVQSAEERYMAQNGVYLAYTAGSTPGLDIVLPKLQYFESAAVSTTTATNGVPTWAGTLNRIATSSSYGPYLVDWTQDGFDNTNSNIPATISPVAGDGGGAGS